MKKKFFVKILFGLICTLIFSLLLSIPQINATSINWTASGKVGTLATGADVEGLADATITLSVYVDEGVYSDVFGLAFVPITKGEIIISGSTIPANNSTFSLYSPFIPATTLGYYPLFPGIYTDSLWPFGFMLDSGNTLTLAHGFSPATPTGASAVPGSTISIADFPTGLGPLNFTVANNSVPPDYLVITQYHSTQATFTATEIPDTEPIPEPATMLLLGTGLVGVAGAARRRKKK